MTNHNLPAPVYKSKINIKVYENFGNFAIFGNVEKYAVLYIDISLSRRVFGGLTPTFFANINLEHA